jgi:hypothetical protein
LPGAPATSVRGLTSSSEVGLAKVPFAGPEGHAGSYRYWMVPLFIRPGFLSISLAKT